MIEHVVYDGAFKQYRLECEHGYFYLDELINNPDQLMWGNAISKHGIIRFDKEWALNNPCSVHTQGKIEINRHEP